MDEKEQQSENFGGHRDQKGRFAEGNPGRPKGIKNKYSRIKEELADLWHDGGMKETLLNLVKTDPKEAKDILKVMASLMPKDEPGDQAANPETLPFRVEPEPDADQEKPV